MNWKYHFLWSNVFKIPFVAWMAVAIPACYAQSYNPIEINNINPQDILPIIWQIEAWDKKAYEHIEHLRIVSHQ